MARTSNNGRAIHRRKRRLPKAVAVSAQSGEHAWRQDFAIAARTGVPDTLKQRATLAAIRLVAEQLKIADGARAHFHRLCGRKSGHRPTQSEHSLLRVRNHLNGRQLKVPPIRTSASDEPCQSRQRERQATTCAALATPVHPLLCAHVCVCVGGCGCVISGEFTTLIPSDGRAHRANPSTVLLLLLDQRFGADTARCESTESDNTHEFHRVVVRSPQVTYGISTGTHAGHRLEQPLRILGETSRENKLEDACLG
jgi:hypothetical protein